MTWNYRVIRRFFPNEDQYTIHEVYYDEQGKPNGVTEDEVSPCGETLEEFKQSLALYVKAVEEPVLDYDTLEEVKPE